MNFAFRVNIGNKLGLGHAKRCLSLAKELKSRDFQCFFFFNQSNEYIKSNFSDFPCFEIGEPEDLNIEERQKQDALCFIDRIKQENIKIDWIVVDDYRLRAPWEKIIKSNDYSLIAIDDLNQDEHLCDIIVDQKFENVQTEQRYQNLTTKNCIKLLGPQFALLSNEYTYDLEQGKKCDPSSLKLLFSIGGGGDFSLYENFLRDLLKDNSIKLTIVIGPMAVNYEFLESINQDNLILKKNLSTLKQVYLENDLFIGALGTSLYELSITKLPAITFSISQNQENDLNDLEAFGHYFHINNLNPSDLSKLLPLINTVKENYPRFKNLGAKSQLNFDHMGCKRIVDSIIHQVNNYPLDDFWDKSIPSAEMIYTLGDFSLCEIKDSHINHYRECRNLPKNSQNMSIRNQITQFEHYNWWFNNNRESYLLYKNNVEELYIWHQAKEFKQNKYLIGGWFVCRENTSFDAAMFALNWQLNYCKEKLPDHKWLAVIKKDNQFVNMLNKYLGFETIDSDSIDFEADQHFFPHASPEEFNFVFKG